MTSILREECLESSGSRGSSPPPKRRVPELRFCTLRNCADRDYDERECVHRGAIEGSNDEDDGDRAQISATLSEDNLALLASFFTTTLSMPLDGRSETSSLILS